MRVLRWVLAGLAAGVVAGFLGGLLGSRRPEQGIPRYVPPRPDDDRPGPKAHTRG